MSNDKKFEWTREQLADLITFARFECLSDGKHSSYSILNRFLEFNTPKPQEQRIEIYDIERLFENRTGIYTFQTKDGQIPKEKLPLIKQAIEQVLNGESIDELKHRIEYWANNNQGNYDRWKETNYELIALKQQVDSMCEEAFMAGRETVEGHEPNGVIGYFVTRSMRYADYQDYKQSKQQP